MLLIVVIYYILKWVERRNGGDDSDEEEDELLRRVEKTTPQAKRSGRDDAPKRISKRARSRSQSVTPPPEVPSSAVLHARAAVRWVFTRLTAPNPTE